jgi:hypothetical protein
MSNNENLQPMTPRGDIRPSPLESITFPTTAIIPPPKIYQSRATIYQQKILNPSTEQGVLNPENNVTYKQVSDILKYSYNFEESMSSTSLDILALYLKGQKVIYTESKTLCEKRLNTLMLPAIFIAAVCAILNFILKEYPYGVIIISSLNAFNSFLLSLISYLKLDGKAEAHKTAAYKYQKLESKCEFHSGKIMFFKDIDQNENRKTIEMVVDEIEKETMEIRESNQFIIPEIVRLRYPKIYSTNVFALVKEIQNDEIIIINKLKTSVQRLHNEISKRNDLKKQIESYENNINLIENELMMLKVELNHTEEKGDLNIRMQYMEEDLKEQDKMVQTLKNSLNESIKNINNYDMEKNEAFDLTVKHRLRYLKLSETFNGEMTEDYERKISSCCNVCDWFKT